MALVTIDGVGYDVSVKELKRSASILDGENAGRSKSGRMRRDIIGTYYNYTLTLNTKSLGQSEYDNLYQVLTAPEDSYIVSLPYGQTTLTFEAYISGTTDSLVSSRGGTNTWGELQVTFTAMAPARTQ